MSKQPEFLFLEKISDLINIAKHGDPLSISLLVHASRILIDPQEFFGILDGDRFKVKIIPAPPLYSRERGIVYKGMQFFMNYIVGSTLLNKALFLFLESIGEKVLSKDAIREFNEILKSLNVILITGDKSEALSSFDGTIYLPVDHITNEIVGMSSVVMLCIFEGGNIILRKALNDLSAMAPVYLINKQPCHLEAGLRMEQIVFGTSSLMYWINCEKKMLSRKRWRRERLPFFTSLELECITGYNPKVHERSVFKQILGHTCYKL